MAGWVGCNDSSIHNYGIINKDMTANQYIISKYVTNKLGATNSPDD